MGWIILFLFFSLFIIALFGYYSILIFAMFFLLIWYEYKRSLKTSKEYNDYSYKFETDEKILEQEEQNKPLVTGGLYYTSPSGNKTKLIDIRIDLK